MPGRGSRAESSSRSASWRWAVFAAVVAFRLPEAGGYARIGPNFVPKFVAGGIILLGIWLLAEVYTGGWRESVPDDAADAASMAFALSAFAGSARACSCRWRSFTTRAS